MSKLFMFCILVLIKTITELISLRRLLKYHSSYLLCFYLRLYLAIYATGMYFQCATDMRFSLCLLVLICDCLFYRYVFLMCCRYAFLIVSTGIY